WHEQWRIGGEPVPVRAALLLNTPESLRAAAIAGAGLVPLPDWVAADAVAAGQLSRVFADFDTPASGIYAVYPTHRLLAPIVRAFVDHLARDLRARGVPA